MIEFIIIDNNEEYIEKYKNLISKEMLKNDFEYKIIINPKNINKDSFKVYIISYKDDKLIDEIRLNDWSSMVIICVNNDSDICHIINKRWMPIDIIIKSFDFDKYFNRALTISINNYSKRPKYLKYTYKNSIYNIPINEIILIQKEKEEKRCLIKTEHNTYLTNESLVTINKKIGDDFIKCNRSTIVNGKQVREYNTKKNIIIFKDEYVFQDISRNCRKTIIKYLRKVD